jgi:hypothetical protein
MSCVRRAIRYLAVVVALALPGAARAAGSPTIAGAPELISGQPVSSTSTSDYALSVTRR